MNPRYLCRDGKLLLGKSTESANDYDVIVCHARYDITEITIPSKIKVIDSFSFFSCLKLQRVAFSGDSVVKIIRENAFACTLIKSISIQSCVSKIHKNAFLLKYTLINNLTYHH